jgi:hypothetical protein
MPIWVFVKAIKESLRSGERGEQGYQRESLEDMYVRRKERRGGCRA